MKCPFNRFEECCGLDCALFRFFKQKETNDKITYKGRCGMSPLNANESIVVHLVTVIKTENKNES